MGNGGGDFGCRWYIWRKVSLVIPGTAYPLPFYPGKIEGIWGAVGTFPITPIELLMSIGTFAFIGLFFILGLKYLELLPADESGQPTPEPAGRT